MDTDDGSDLSIDCTSAYGEELSQQALIMVNRVQDQINHGALSGNNQTLVELVHSNLLSAIGQKVNFEIFSFYKSKAFSAILSVSPFITP